MPTVISAADAGLPFNPADYVKMRPRTGRNSADRELLTLLERAMEDLLDAPCCFWACDGPNRPQDMVTCRRCWALRRTGENIPR